MDWQARHAIARHGQDVLRGEWTGKPGRTGTTRPRCTQRSALPLFILNHKIESDIPSNLIFYIYIIRSNFGCSFVFQKLRRLAVKGKVSHAHRDVWACAPTPKK